MVGMEGVPSVSAVSKKGSLATTTTLRTLLQEERGKGEVQEHLEGLATNEVSRNTMPQRPVKPGEHRTRPTPFPP